MFRDENSSLELLVASWVVVVVEVNEVGVYSTCLNLKKSSFGWFLFNFIDIPS